MKRNYLMAAVLTAAFCHGVASADGHQGAGQEMSPEEAAMMAALQQSMTPGEPHAWLAELTGEFTGVVRSFGDPSGEPSASECDVVRRMELGGRVLHETWTGEVMGMPFSGIGRTGYDNVAKRYWTTWTDNLSTGVFVAYGQRSDDGKMVFEGEMSNPMTGGMTPTRSVAWHEGDIEQMEMFEVIDGQEVKTMSFEIRRR